MEIIEHVEDENPHHMIHCCDCGAVTEVNPANLCKNCFLSGHDISEGIPKQGVLFFCRKCERYLQPPNQWVSCHKNEELVTMCLKRMKKLSTVKLLDAKVLFTEPHSKRLKLKLTIQGEIRNVTLQQSFIVEYTVQNYQCDDCHRVEAKDYWKACVQIRQNAEHKRTFYYLEQLLLRHDMHKGTVNIKQTHGGIDFFFAAQQEALKLRDFLSSVVPCRTSPVSKTLISHDVHSGTYNYKFTYIVELVPICKDNVVCLPKNVAQAFGNLSQVVVCTRVMQLVTLVDPSTARLREVRAKEFFAAPFRSLCQPKDLTQFMVLDIESVDEENIPHSKGGATVSSRHHVAAVWLERLSQLGSGHHIFTRTHLGHLLSVGDIVLGFDVRHSNVNCEDLEKLSQDKIPDVVIVRKIIGDPDSRRKNRKFKLKRMHYEKVSESVDGDFEEFMQELEEDPVKRTQVNLYHDKGKVTQVLSGASDESEMAVDGDDDQFGITLESLLDDLQLDGCPKDS